MAEKRLLVIGGVAAGPKAAAKARRCDPEMEITVIERGECISYAACGLPYHICDVVEEEDLVVKTPQDFKQVKDIDVLLRHEALAIDRSHKEVEVRDLETGNVRRLPYDKLILAVGASPFVPPLPGIDHANVFTLHTVGDAVAIKKLIDDGRAKRAVIVGGGPIGLEAAEAFRMKGLDVTVVEMADQVLVPLDREMALLVQKHLAEKGVAVLTSEKATRFEGNAQGEVARVVTDKRTIDTDLVLIAVGIRPNIDLAQRAGLEIGKSHAIKVNDRLETSDPDIYAAGDCIETVNIASGMAAWAPLGSAANKLGRVAAVNATGGTDTFRGLLKTLLVKVFDLNVGRVGITEREARELGYEVETAIVPAMAGADYYPGHKRIITKLVVNKWGGKLLGAQIVGPGDVSKRIDVAVTALTFGADVHQMANLDLGYAPPYAPAMDPIITAANVVRNKLAGAAQGISPLAVKEKLDRQGAFFFLDVRNQDEHDEVRLPGATLVPLPHLRSRLGEIPRDKEIIAFCAVSLRAYEASLILKANGFRDVKFMDGGIAAWPFETEGEA